MTTVVSDLTLKVVEPLPVKLPVMVVACAQPNGHWAGLSAKLHISNLYNKYDNDTNSSRDPKHLHLHQEYCLDNRQDRSRQSLCGHNTHRY
jgi:hypothetical protein